MFYIVYILCLYCVTHILPVITCTALQKNSPGPELGAVHIHVKLAPHQTHTAPLFQKSVNVMISVQFMCRNRVRISILPIMSGFVLNYAHAFAID